MWQHPSRLGTAPHHDVCCAWSHVSEELLHLQFFLSEFSVPPPATATGLCLRCRRTRGTSPAATEELDTGRKGEKWQVQKLGQGPAFQEFLRKQRLGWRRPQQLLWWFQCWYSLGESYSGNWWPRHSGTPAETPSWAATMALGAMEMEITGSMKDIAVNVASKWAKLVSNVVVKTAAGAMKSAILGDSDTAATATAEVSQKSSSSAPNLRLGRTRSSRWQHYGETPVTWAEKDIAQYRKEIHKDAGVSQHLLQSPFPRRDQKRKPGRCPMGTARPTWSNRHWSTACQIKYSGLSVMCRTVIQKNQKRCLTRSWKKKTVESQRYDGDEKKQLTKIERLQEKFEEPETRNHCIIERARDSVPTQRRRPRPVIEVQRVPHPDTDGSTTLPWPSSPPSAALPCPQQVPSRPTGAGHNNMTVCPTQADDDCSLSCSRWGTATCACQRSKVWRTMITTWRSRTSSTLSAEGTLPLPWTPRITWTTYMWKKYTAASGVARTRGLCAPQVNPCHEKT